MAYQDTLMTDFCQSELIKCVTSDTVASEGYEVTNLVSSRLCEKQRGFLAEGFIKPPIKLTFNFICEIDVYCIVIVSTVGAQRCAGIDIFALSMKNPNYECIGTGFLRNLEDGCVFHKYGSDIGLHSVGLLHKHVGMRNLNVLNFKSARFLKSVYSVQIKIFKTAGSSVPALAKVEIWGAPAKNCPTNILTVIKNIKSQTSVVHPDRIKSSGGLQHKSDTNNRTRPRPTSRHIEACHTVSENQSEGLVIPEDFIDPITFEIMCLPIILPSGKAIDNSTLEQYTKAESAWGRAPSDPFTGVLLSDLNKPIAACALKARIDKFLSDHSNDAQIKDLPRTTGTTFTCRPTMNSCYKDKFNTGRVRVSKLLCPSTNISETLCDGLAINTNNSSDNESRFNLVEDNKIVSKKLKLNDRPITSVHNLSFSATSRKVNPSLGQDISSRPASSYSKFENKSSLSHEDKLEQSLELALKATLSSLPSLTKSISGAKDSARNMECISCQTNTNLFKIPCFHLICRCCLMSLKKEKQLMCNVCGTIFQSSVVERIHCSQT